MSEVYIIADVHLNEWVEFSSILPDGTNSRLQNGVDCLKQAIEAAKDQTLIIAGDLFHTRDKISVPVLHKAGEVIGLAAQTCREVIILVGNHDQHLKDGRVHSLVAFGNFSNVIVVAEPMWYKPAGFTDILLMPYMNDYDEFRAVYARMVKGLKPGSKRLAVLHADIIGFEMNGGFLAKHGVTAQFTVNAGGDHAVFDLVISGHYHKPQKFDGLPVHYVGSPYQLDRAEAGDEKRFIRLNEDLVMSDVLVTGMPKFRKVAFKKAKEEHGTKDFIDVVCDEDEVRDGWKMPGQFNIVLTPKQGRDHSFAAMQIESAVQKWLRQENREDLTERAMERTMRASSSV